MQVFTNASAFSKNLLAISRGLEVRIGGVAQMVAEAIHGALVLGTPVKTGLARSNWQVGKDGNVPDGVAKIRSEVETISAGHSIIRGRPSAEYNIVNHVDYVANLNAGSSRQAPAGFIEKAIQVGARVASENVIQLITEADT